MIPMSKNALFVPSKGRLTKSRIAGYLTLQSVNMQLCSHCGNEHVVKWGHSGGLQRYQCQSLTCHKTFNAVTETSLARLHHRTKWVGYLRCMQDSFHSVF